MEIQNDFDELLALFNARGVEYLIVGGYAVAHHGAPRYTGDIDLYVRPSKENAARVHQALVDFGFGEVELSPSDFEATDRVVQLGVPPVRVDIVTSISGVDWDSCWGGRVEGSYGATPVFFLGRTELIENKRRTGCIDARSTLASKAVPGNQARA